MSEAANLRGRLSHPVIDADGHWLETGPVDVEALTKIGGDAARRGIQLNGERVRRSLSMTPKERRHENVAQEAFWGAPTKNTRDRATAMLPALMYERLDEFGIDYAVLFPTMGLGFPRIDDTEARRALCRAFNIYCAELFEPFSDRMSPVAVIPMHDPEEAVAELEHAVGELGLKAVTMNSLIERPVGRVADERPDASDLARWFDVIGLDSAHDYAASEATCKALFLGGVSRRFSDLNFGFLEGGVGFACLLYADLIGHWQIRNGDALEYTDPAQLDLAELTDLTERYGGSEMIDAVRSGKGISTRNGAQTTGGLAELDDYSACEITEATDIKSLFVDRFYFGCEADDATNAWAFNTKNNPFDAEIKTLFGSDVGHFDVQDMAGVLPEAYELVEDEKITDRDFSHFVFENPVRFWGETNPRFFEGTRVAKEAQALLESEGDVSP